MKLILISFLLAIPYLLHAQDVRLNITVSNIHSAEGTIFIAVFSNEAAYPDGEKAFSSVSVKAMEPTVNTRLNLPKGRYAICVLHDKNKDKKLNTNFFGMPTEGYGFSENPGRGFSQPSFDDVAFNLTGDQSMNIRLIHW